MLSARPLLTAALAILTQPAVDSKPHAIRTDGRVRATLGAEWDTNAKRALSDTANLTQDGLSRLVLDLAGSVEIGGAHWLDLGYVLGAKRFFTESSEDLWVHDLRGTTTHRLTTGMTASLFSSFRSNRIKSGLRDYDLFHIGAEWRYQPIKTLRFMLHGGFQNFSFAPEQRFAYRGPEFGGTISFNPTPKLQLQGGLEVIRRDYRGNALVVGTRIVENTEEAVLTFCDDPLEGLTCTPIERDDQELRYKLGIVYQGGFIVGADYLLMVQRSTSNLEDIDRHRASAFISLWLPLKLSLSLLGQIQFSQGVSVTQNRLLQEDDEAQNSVELQLARHVTTHLRLELRYAFFRNQFNSNNVHFARHTVYVGLGYLAESH